MELPNAAKASRQSQCREIVAKCRAGKWYPLDKIAEVIGASEVITLSVIERMCWPSRTAYGVKAERKKVGSECHFRIFKQDKTVSVEELTTKLRPIVEGQGSAQTVDSRTSDATDPSFHSEPVSEAH